MEVGEVQALATTVGGAAGTRGRACPVDTGVSRRTLRAGCTAVVIIGVVVDAFSSADILSGRARCRANAVDACLT